MMMTSEKWIFSLSLSLCIENKICFFFLKEANPLFLFPVVLQFVRLRFVFLMFSKLRMGGGWGVLN